MNFKNIIGWASVTLLITAYALLSFDYITSKSIIYNAMNLFAGGGLAYRVYLDKNYANFTLEILFCLIAIKSIFSELW
jgi:hypothetical protein